MPSNNIARVSLPVLALTLAVMFSPVPAQAEEVVQIGGGRAILNLPAGRPSVGLILLPGGDGAIGLGDDGSIDRQGNWIVRTRGAYRSAGMASLLLDAGADVGSALTYMRRIAPRVVLVAMSRGSTKVPGALNYNPDGVVFASSMLSTVRGSLWSASSLPQTLVLHHRKDQCHVTHFADVEPFAQWAGSKVRVRWIDGGSAPSGRMCGGQHWHGFPGRESAVVGAIIGFARGVR
ncbi:MAG: alpha/beta hydrolase [Rhabdaerophilum sp.]